MDNKILKPLLAVEDKPGLQKQLKWAFEAYHVHVAGTRSEALSILKKYPCPVITLDLGLPPDPANASEGLLALKEILKFSPNSKIIVVTGNDDRQNALHAISLGAYDFYQKPIDVDILGLIIDRAYQLYELEEENRKWVVQNARAPLDGLVGNSEQILATCRMVKKVGPSEVTSLVLGESGTGKELIAQALHQLSPRRDKPFVALNCAAIPETLLESELFGYEKGAFTGAIKQTPGKIESANSGTFFLDEIGDMPMSLQAKMLRFLQERVVERIGGRHPIEVDVRIICATHHDLNQAIKDGNFREDLYFRISEITIDIPPLRKREGDKVLLAQHFLNAFSHKSGRSFRGYTEDALLQIDNYAWPGNVRELENKVKRAVVLADGNRITETDLGFSTKIDMCFSLTTETQSLNLNEGREQVERQLIHRALSICDNNVTHAAEALDISRPSLYNLIKKLGMKELNK